ncbi:hypothetical protein [Sporosarcina limicola]|uniref:Uncharacterized protein n=1 Tax=Sporosarcina limicola TaxID=34101 RepID=A0A927MQS0_9BACL|nr:hypothetical protein [Sporosarcina limicola]MBE1555774.1 hypothetical protein [Sporosarcina limicola]
MNLSILILLPFLIVIPIIVYIMRPKKPSKWTMNKKWTYVFFATYTAVLLLAALTVELFDKKLATKPFNHFSTEDFKFIESALHLGNLSAIDPSQVIDKRTHDVGDTLHIKSYDNNPLVFIERKSENDGWIEETLFKPILIINEADFSDQVNYTKPEWEGDTVTFPVPPFTELTFTSYQDSLLLGQFTRQPPKEFGYRERQSRQIVIYLHVPKDLIIKANEDFDINYVNK